MNVQDHGTKQKEASALLVSFAETENLVRLYLS